jgi:hypothetical protein
MNDDNKWKVETRLASARAILSELVNNFALFSNNSRCTRIQAAILEIRDAENVFALNRAELEAHRGYVARLENTPVRSILWERIRARFRSLARRILLG